MAEDPSWYVCTFCGRTPERCGTCEHCGWTGATTARAYYVAQVEEHGSQVAYQADVIRRNGDRRTVDHLVNDPTDLDEWEEEELRHLIEEGRCQFCLASYDYNCVCLCADSHLPDCDVLGTIPARIHKGNGKVLEPERPYVKGLGVDAKTTPCSCGRRGVIRQARLMMERHDLYHRLLEVGDQDDKLAAFESHRAEMKRLRETNADLRDRRRKGIGSWEWITREISINEAILATLRQRRDRIKLDVDITKIERRQGVQKGRQQVDFFKKRGVRLTRPKPSGNT